METSSGMGGMGTAGQKVNVERMSQTAHEMVDRAAATASSMAQRMGQKSEELIAYKDEWMDTTRTYVREHPMAALGIALAAGFLLSIMTRSSR